MIGTLSRLWRSDRGVSAVEFAMVLPFLGMMIVGIVDVSRGFVSRIALQQAIDRTLEKAAVGTVQTDYDFLRAEAAAAAAIPLERVVLDTWLECNGARQPLFSGSCESDQMVSRYVSISARSNFKPMFRYGAFGMKLFATDSAGISTMSTTSVLRVQ